MGERKVLNKYFPPDFDPKLVPKTKWDPFKQIETRMMLPFNVQVRARVCQPMGRIRVVVDALPIFR
jgi:hypothetical protein